jgi:HSP20 family protein
MTTNENALTHPTPSEATAVNEIPKVIPRADIYEDDKSFLLFLDLPGVPTEDLSVSIDDGQITVEGMRPSFEEDIPIASEFRSVRYVRSFRVPRGLDSDKVSGELKNGVLRLSLQKPEQLRPKQIEVKVG